MRVWLHLGRCLGGGLLISLLLLAALTAWVWQPFDQAAWRVKLPLPGGMQVRVVPVLMLATSAPGRWLLDRRAFSLHHGDIQLYDQQGLHVRCRQCWLEARAVSDQPLVIPQVELWIQMQQHQFKGRLRAGEAGKQFSLYFEGWASMRQVRLNWQLPATPLRTLLRPLHSHSAAIARAHVTGWMTASGTLRWPKPRWRAQPQLYDLRVSGLDIGAATQAPLHYDCPLLDENRHPEKMQWLTTDKLGRWLPMATIIAEDAEFRHHPGYLLGQMQHLLGQDSADKVVGGSTITQQLAKYLFTNGERSWKRKIEELLYAVQLEATLDKQQILTLYLNTVDLGPGLCGVHAAAAYYFDLPAHKLNPLQAAWLAGIIANPHRAWKQQFMAQQPDTRRAERILQFMSPSARLHPGALHFRLPPAKTR